jgi:uncharacterized Zn-finger protein
MQPFETIYVDSMQVSCDGDGGAHGHPKVYLNLSADGEIECPYCSRLFVHESKRGREAMPPAHERAAHSPKP